MNKTPSICVFPSVREKKKKSTYCDKEIGFICVDFCSKECNNFAGTEIPILSVFNQTIVYSVDLRNGLHN